MVWAPEGRGTLQRGERRPFCERGAERKTSCPKQEDPAKFSWNNILDIGKSP